MLLFSFIALSQLGNVAVGDWVCLEHPTVYDVSLSEVPTSRAEVQFVSERGRVIRVRFDPIARSPLSRRVLLPKDCWQIDFQAERINDPKVGGISFEWRKSTEHADWIGLRLHGLAGLYEIATRAPAPEVGPGNGFGDGQPEFAYLRVSDTGRGPSAILVLVPRPVLKPFSVDEDTKRFFGTQELVDAATGLAQAAGEVAVEVASERLARRARKTLLRRLCGSKASSSRKKRLHKLAEKLGLPDSTEPFERTCSVLATATLHDLAAHRGRSLRNALKRDLAYITSALAKRLLHHTWKRLRDSRSDLVALDAWFEHSVSPALQGAIQRRLLAPFIEERVEISELQGQMQSLLLDLAFAVKKGGKDEFVTVQKCATQELSSFDTDIQSLTSDLENHSGSSLFANEIKSLKSLPKASTTDSENLDRLFDSFFNIQSRIDSVLETAVIAAASRVRLETAALNRYKPLLAEAERSRLRAANSDRLKAIKVIKEDLDEQVRKAEERVCDARATLASMRSRRHTRPRVPERVRFTSLSSDVATLLASVLQCSHLGNCTTAQLADFISNGDDYFGASVSSPRRLDRKSAVALATLLLSVLQPGETMTERDFERLSLEAMVALVGFVFERVNDREALQSLAAVRDLVSVIEGEDPVELVSHLAPMVTSLNVLDREDKRDLSSLLMNVASIATIAQSFGDASEAGQERRRESLRSLQALTFDRSRLEGGGILSVGVSVAATAGLHVEGPDNDVRGVTGVALPMGLAFEAPPHNCALGFFAQAYIADPAQYGTIGTSGVSDELDGSSWVAFGGTIGVLLDHEFFAALDGRASGLSFSDRDGMNPRFSLLLGTYVSFLDLASW